MGTRDDSGQASIEHVGLVLLVALALLGAGAISAIAAPGLLNRVTTAMQRSLCVVSGAACPTLQREPCPMRRTERTRSTKVSLGFLRLGDDRALTIERRSDGSYVIGVVEGAGGGVGATVSRPGADASADAVLTGKAGRTYRAANAAEARALVERLQRRALPAADAVVAGVTDLVGLADADPAVDSYTLAGKGAVNAAAKLGLGELVGAGAGIDGGAEIGLRIAAHQREATAYIALDGRVNAFFDALPSASIPHGKRRRGERRDDPDGAAAAGPLAKVINPDKLEQEAEAFASGVVALRLAPGPRVLEVEVTGTVGAGAGAREVHARLDPESAEVAAALAAWRSSPIDAGRLAALGRAASANAALDERRFAVASEQREIGGEIGIGASLGLSSVKGLRTMTLVEQRSRPVGGVWEQRLDCEAA
ncbi:MAG: hypothetical protein J7513_04165 [Solirubrobacteraceae bacterium]|nr:hypothetical protein [Solirubrobacteraceae bacterium]